MFKKNTCLSVFLMTLFASSSSLAQGTCLELFTSQTLSENLTTSLAMTPGGAALIALGPLRKTHDPVAFEKNKLEMDFLDQLHSHRMRFITERLTQTLESSKPDQFLIFYTGVMHAVDLFKGLGVRPDVAYLNPSLQEVRLHPHLQLIKKLAAIPLPPHEVNFLNTALNMVLENVSVSTTMLENALVKFKSGFDFEADHSLDLETHIDFFNNFLIQFSDKNEPRELSQIRAAVVGDIHYLNSTGFLDSLPTADSLRQQGVREVVILVEGWRASKKINRRDLELTSLVNLYEDIMATASPSLRRQLLKDMAKSKNLKEAYSLLNVRRTMNPTLRKILQITDAYAAKGIKVIYRGAEPDGN